MSDVSLLYATGDPAIDAVLRGLVDAFETGLPGRVRGYYLTGSYAEGSAQSFSDVDLAVLFRDGFRNPDEEGTAEEIIAQCARVSPVELDVAPLPEEVPYPLRSVSIKLGSRLIYGEDLRDAMPLPPMDAYVRHAMDLAFRLLVELRGGAELVSFPIDYPDPADEFFGYARVEAPPAEGQPALATKHLVVSVGLATTAIVATSAACYVAGKRDAVRLYQQRVSDAWTELVTAIPERCRDTWGYELPEAADARRELQHLCRQVRDFEDHFLTLYREHLRTEVALGQSQPDAARRLEQFYG